MNTAESLDGAWVAKIDGKLFLLNFSGDAFELVFQLPQGTSLSMGTFTVDQAKRPAQIDLMLTDGIGKNGDRLKGRSAAAVVRGIVEHDGDALRFFAPPPELDGRPAAFPDAEPGFVGPNIYLVLKRAA
jgi:uncharacterized protein (TIGR03067 family)